MLRRICSTYMAQLTSVKDVQAHLQHSSAKMLEHYIKSVPASVRAAINSRTRAVLAKQQEVFAKPGSATCPNVSQSQKVESASG